MQKDFQIRINDAFVDKISVFQGNAPNLAYSQKSQCFKYRETAVIINFMARARQEYIILPVVSR